MDRTDCQNERFSSKTVGIVFIVLSFLLLSIGLVILPVVGFVFAVPLLMLGVGLIMSPESKTCQLIMRGLGTKKA